MIKSYNEISWIRFNFLHWILYSNMLNLLIVQISVEMKHHKITVNNLTLSNFLEFFFA